MSFKRITHASTVDAIDALSRSLIAFEQKYKISSDDFYANYLAGKLGDSKDFVEWAGDYQHYIEMKHDLKEKLKVAV